MTNWINNYGPNPRKFQEGGPMAPPAAAPEGAPAGGAPDLEAMLAEYAQSRDPQLAVAICDALVEMMAAQAGPQAGPPAGPEGPEGPPMARRGTKLRKGPVFKK